MENTKKTLSILLFFFISSLTLFNCREIDKDTPKPKPVDPPKEIVSIEEAKVQYKAYGDRRAPLIQRYEDSVDGYSNEDKIRQEQNDQKAQVDPNDPNGNRFDVARYVYWDYDTIKKYLKYIEQEAKASNIEISTLRFYFSNYDENSDNVHPRQNSIIITPTLRKNDREYIFEIDDSDPENQKPILLTDSFGPVQSQEKGMGAANNVDDRSHASFIPNTAVLNSVAFPFNPGKSVTMNRGNAAPPPYHEE